MVKRFIFSVAIPTFVLCVKHKFLRCSVVCLPVVVTADKVLKVGLHSDLHTDRVCALTLAA